MKIFFAVVTFIFLNLALGVETPTEDQIPVRVEAVKKAETTDVGAGRFILVMGAVTLLAGVAYFLAKRYSKPGHSQQTQIKVLTQHYLGPKKSLAIVRVAGESVLIGVTDHSINLIKSLSLLDDEIPETVQNNFETTLKNESQNGISGTEEFSIRHIKDVVSLKLKGMRNDL